MLFRPSELLPQVAELGLLTCVLGEQTRDSLLGAGRREDVLLAKEQALSEVRGLGTGLGLRGLLLVLMALSWRLFWRVRARGAIARRSMTPWKRGLLSSLHRYR